MSGYTGTMESMLNLLKEIWKEHKEEYRQIGYSYEDFILKISNLNGRPITHDQFVAWVANGRIPHEN